MACSGYLSATRMIIPQFSTIDKKALQYFVVNAHLKAVGMPLYFKISLHRFFTNIALKPTKTATFFMYIYAISNFNLKISTY